MKLVTHRYGKSRVRLMKVLREGEAHAIKELTARVLLEGDFDRSYTDADNSQVVATDTMKNTLYVLAHEHLGAENEPFAQQVARHFLDRHRHVSQVIVELDERVWTRLPQQAYGFTRMRVLVFALHGMGPNTAWADRCADMLARILAGGPGVCAPRRGLVYAAKQAIPWRLARAVTARIPPELQARLVPLWSSRMYDWRTTRAFPLPMDHAGYVRVNLRGREPRGIVPPEEYSALCDQIAQGFLSFRDAASGRPIARRVHRMDELASRDAPARHRLPDLVVEWADVPPGAAPVIRSESLGELSWSSPKLTSGRAGNHEPDGWFVARGPGIGTGPTAAVHPIVDLVPTVYRWLGLEPDEALAGRPIPELAE